MKKHLLISLGWIFVGIGILGIILPLLPATPFFLLAAVCFHKSSPKFYQWLLHNKYFGKYIRDYKQKKGLSLKAKIYGLIMLNGTIAYSIYVLPDKLFLNILLIVVAVGVSMFMLRIKTITEND